ncbi:tetratricopeptide repeat protein [Thalassovita taeanensis]|uniref:TPR repeat-containing protein n=1 Tax=Thalassovita taeanensis TaxID=657014 RepID=A0A1H9ARC4_9RHOB|nr:tetratricopeptide repeat protein [Thalassovita taeanensis]SEP79199.1 TPR repeat-containing protein [Thalassovita taeanensis]
MRNRILGLALCVAVGAVAAPSAQAQGIAGAYLAARQAGMTADYQAASEYYTRALARDPGNPQLLEAATLSQLSLGQLSRAIPIARKIEADGLRSQVAQMVLMADEVASGKYAAVLERILSDHGVGPLVDGLAGAWAQMGQGDVSGALESFDTVANERGLSGFALYHKALALATVGDFEGAEAIFAENAGGPLQMTRRGAIARIEMLSQLERGDEAIALVDALFGSELDPGLRALRASLAGGKTLPFTMMRGPQDGVAEVFYSVAAALNSEAGADYTLLYARVAEYLRPDHTDAVLLSASLLDDLERFDLAVEAYQRVPSDSAAFHAAELGRAEALRRSDRVDEAVTVLESLAKTHGDLPVVHVTLGDLMRQLKRYDAAVGAYDRALGLYEKPENEQWFIYYARAISHERLNEWPAAEADFRMALELNPDQPQVLNYLGYSMVEQKVKLDEALAMIERAAAGNPDSGYIIDSLGWVLYRLGRYDEAVGHMERAAELMPVDPVVNDHLGDVLWAVGRKREAEFQWRRALSFVDDENASGEVDPDRIRAKLEIGLDAVLVQYGEPPLKVADDRN